MRIAESVVFGGAGGAADPAGDAAAVLDRAAPHRTPEAAARLAGDAHARVLALARGRVPMASGGGLAWLPVAHPLLAEAGPFVLLGIASGADGGPRFAADLPPERAEALAGGLAFGDLRDAAPGLSPIEAELAATARALLAWHASHGFCARCGGRSTPALAGWQRHCPGCGAHHFPRTDPVVIMLVTQGERALLGRSPGWPEGMYSLLAGFVEPGETIEAAVRRETYEEVGVRVAEVGYLASQPWPFPASLMIGCRARALARALHPDRVEIEDALWLTREALALAFAGRHPRVRPPREGAIAGFLLRAWLADRLD